MRPQIRHCIQEDDSFRLPAVIVLGAATAVGGICTLLGRSWGTKPWLLLAVAAPFIHFPWFMYRVIATGMKPEGTWDRRLFAIPIPNP